MLVALATEQASHSAMPEQLPCRQESSLILSSLEAVNYLVRSDNQEGVDVALLFKDAAVVNINVKFPFVIQLVNFQ